MRSTTRALAALMCAVALVGSACSDDDDTTDATGTGTTEDTGDNAIGIEMSEYAYVVDGTLEEGWTTFDLTNTGDEFHMIGFGRMRDGVDLDTVKTTLQEAFGGGGEGEGEGGEEPAGEGASDANATEDDHALGEVQLISAQSDDETTSTAPEGDGEDGDAGGEGGEDEDPFAKLFHEEVEGPPGGFVGPGQSISFTTDGLEAGEYAMVCFLPTPDGESDHISEGMIGSFTVEASEEPAGTEPEADHEIAIGDESIEMPEELEAGETTFKATFEGGEHELAFTEVKDEDATLDSLKEYFAGYEEKLPTAADLADAPALLWGFSHSVTGSASYYVTVDLTAGRWLIGDTMEEYSDEGEVTRDHSLTETKFVTVT